jgi:sulfite reductase (ferredoxin)
MCKVCGCTAGLDAMSENERIKASSNHLRGSIAEELREDTTHFAEENGVILKFHGIYQQDDRDRRKEARAKGLDKHHMMMIRTRIPGGIVSPGGYLAHDHIAGKWGNGTLRVTTRQDFQLHGVLKGDLWNAMHAINASLMTTLGGCGDQERNIMTCPAPIRDRFREEVLAILKDMVAGLTPQTRAYHEIWIDGELAASAEPETEPLYGETYLPRKFKTAIALEGDNCVDVYAQDLAIVAMRGTGGGLQGFTIMVGGGLGRTHNKPETFPAVAVPMAYVEPDQLVKASQAVVSVQRDYGDRTNRRHARLKYLIADRGVAWFREQVQARLDFPLQNPRLPLWKPVDDHLGWQAQRDGRIFLGLYVENGRIADVDGVRLRTGLRAIVEELRPQVVLTPQQNVILADLHPIDRPRIEALLHEHGIQTVDRIAPTIRYAMACPAIPTCGLAVAEAERALPSLIRQIEAVVASLGLEEERISYRMSGCPNGCSRPYLGDVGFVGTTLGKYDIYLGGDFTGTRLNELYARNVPIQAIPDLLRAPLEAFRDERRPEEGFGDWTHRVGVETLRSRFGDPHPALPQRGRDIEAHQKGAEIEVPTVEGVAAIGSPVS